MFDNIDEIIERFERGDFLSDEEYFLMQEFIDKANYIDSRRDKVIKIIKDIQKEQNINKINKMINVMFKEAENLVNTVEL